MDAPSSVALQVGSLLVFLFFKFLQLTKYTCNVLVDC